jgi:OHCU decarboxylase
VGAPDGGGAPFLQRGRSFRGRRPDLGGALRGGLARGLRRAPEIGERASGQAAAEQAGRAERRPETLAALARANREYQERFGYIFIVCASGRSAEEMLDLCRQRLHNAPAEELKVAAEEQRKITRLRLEKWLSSL